MYTWGKNLGKNFGNLSDMKNLILKKSVLLKRSCVDSDLR